MQPAAPAPHADHDTDDAILARIAAGDPRAFESLMRRYNRRLFRVARSILQDDVEAEDALQDAYLQAFRALPNFRGDAALSTWLTRIVMNAALMRHRKIGRQAEIIELSAEIDMDDSRAAPMAAPSQQPERALLRAQARQLIEAGIDGLPTGFRTVFVLRALEELSVEETALVLDIPEATVRTRFFRARGLLREALAREIDVAYEDTFAFDGARCDRIVANVMGRLGEMDS